MGTAVRHRHVDGALVVKLGMRRHRRLLREMSDHDLLQALMASFLRWRLAEPADNSELDVWCMYRNEVRRRSKQFDWRGCTCAECFMDPQIGQEA